MLGINYIPLLCRRPFYEKRISTEIAADHLGEEWKVICLAFA